MRALKFNNLEEYIKYQPPRTVFPQTRVYTHILSQLKAKKRARKLTWEEVLTEMSLRWLKKK